MGGVGKCCAELATMTSQVLFNNEKFFHGHIRIRLTLQCSESPWVISKTDKNP